MPKKKPAMPVVPRDHDVATFSEMVPFRSSKIKLSKSPMMYFAVFSALLTPFMFGLFEQLVNPGDPQQRLGAFVVQSAATVLYLVVVFLIGAYAYARPGKPLWFYSITFVIICVIVGTPLFNVLAFPFRGIIPGIVEMGTNQTDVIQSFIGMFFIAGLAEEFIKAVPILVAAALAWKAQPGKGKKSIWRLEGPLDGVVMGLFAGAGFIFLETAFEYVPGIAQQISQQSGDQNLGMVGGFSLLLPRVFGGISGHMGYSAIFGYFIGLSVMRPGQRWKLILIGWLVSSLLHAVWNSFGQHIPILSYPISIIVVIFTVGCLVKARQLHMSQSGALQETFGSIIVPKTKASSATPKQVVAPPATAPAPAPSPAPPAQSAPGTGQQIVSLNINGVMFPLRAGETIDLAQESSLAGMAQGITGMVVAHPSRVNVLGLRNTGTTAWNARLRDGSRQVIEAGQNIRLAANVQIEFGNGLNGLVMAAG